MSSYYRSILNTLTVPFTNTKSILLDGVDDFVQTPTITLSSDFSVSIWFKKINTGTYRQLLGGTDIFLFGFVSFDFGVVYNGEICYWSGSQYVKLTDQTAADGNWHHLIVTYKDSTQNLKSYFDGSLYYNDTFNAGSSPSISIIGKNTAHGRNWGGNIDEVSVFNSELSASDVTAIYGTGVPNDISSLSPLSWYRCGDGDTAPTLTDNGSGGNNGTMTNFSTFSTDVPT
tara:strand:- start:726 stop:1412 length:687 start_codon:yes stop_codon:yes gene_type:complete